MTVFTDLEEQLANPAEPWVGEDRPPFRRRLRLAAFITGGLTLLALAGIVGWFVGAWSVA